MRGIISTVGVCRTTIEMMARIRVVSGGSASTRELSFLSGASSEQARGSDNVLEIELMGESEHRFPRRVPRRTSRAITCANGSLFLQSFEVFHIFCLRIG